MCGNIGRDSIESAAISDGEITLLPSQVPVCRLEVERDGVAVRPGADTV